MAILLILFLSFSSIYANTGNANTTDTALTPVSVLPVTQSATSLTPVSTLPDAISTTTQNILPENITIEAKINYAVEKIDFDTNTINTIILKWDKKEGEEFIYNIYKKSEGFDYAKINNAPITVTFYVDTDINTGTIYYYKIETIDRNGNAYLSNEFSVKSADLFLPYTPSNFKIYQDIESSVLKWNASSKGTFELAGYIIYRGEDADDLIKIAQVKPTDLRYDDEDVVPGKKYYYKISAIDTNGYESKSTEIQSCVPFPMPRTSLILMPTAYRNDIFNNWGLNVDFNFTYYIGGIYGAHNLFPYGEDSDSFLKVGASILSGDLKLSGFNDENNIPSIAMGYNYIILMQDKFGSSQITGVQTSFSGKEKEAMKMMGGFYGVLSKKAFWDFSFHTGYILGEQLNFIPYLSKYLNYDDNLTQHGYYFGFSRKIFSRMGIRCEFIVPVENKINPSFILPRQYLINTYIDRFINFNLSYFHFNGGYIWLGYISFRFTIFPSPYK